MATGGGSVFAKQFAGRIKQVGRDGDVRASVASGAGSGAAGGGNSRVAPKAKAKSSSSRGRTASPSPSPAAENDDEDADDLGGGTMSCANRDLLRQMLQGAEKQSSSEEPSAAVAPASKARPAAANLKAPAQTASAPVLKAKASVVTASAPRSVASKPATLSAPAPKSAAPGATPVRTEVNEGTMACANRDLLKQMLQSADKRDESDMPHSDVFIVDDEFDGGFFSRAEEEEEEGQDVLGMSSRLVPGTPKSGTRQRSVPTISSPAALRGPPAKNDAPQARAVSSSAVPVAAKAKVAVSKAMPVAGKSSMPQKVLTGPPQRGPPQKILTGPPQRAPPPGAYSAPRPGSRGGAAEQVQELLTSPAHRQGKSSVPSTPTSATGYAAGGRAKGYANIHGGRAGSKAAGPSPKSSSPVVQQPARPRCGPAAFDMLRKLDDTPAQQRRSDVDGFGEESPGVAAEAEEDEDDGFVMPSDNLSEDGDQDGVGDKENLANGNTVFALPGRPQPAPLQVHTAQVGAKSKGNNSNAPPRQGSASSLGSNSVGGAAAAGQAGTGDRESAADYVERMKRNFGTVAPVAPTASESSANTVVGSHSYASETKRQSIGNAEDKSVSSASAAMGAHAPTPGASRHNGDVAQKGASHVRARSSDPRVAVAAARAADLANATTRAGSGGASANTRARSSEPRASVTFSRHAEKESHDDDDDSDDDLPAGAGAGCGPSGEPWKLNVKSLVKEFAQEERSRNAGAKNKTAAPRPPKAPAKATAAMPPHVAAGDQSDQQANEPGEQLFFSRKPREVDYTPASLDSYKQKGYDKKQMNSMKSLGPDLEDENLLLKKAEKEKMKDFSKELQRINKSRMQAAASRGGSKVEPKSEQKPNARAKALEFANRLPKPKPEARQVEPRKPKENVPQPPKATTEAEKMQDDWDEIRRREKQHFEDVIKVQEIRDFLNQMP